MTIGADFRQAWIDKFERNRAFYEGTVNPFVNWEVNKMPESEAEDNLTYALVILYAGIDESLAGKFLQAALDVVDRAVTENKFTSRWCVGFFPMNLGRAVRTRCYARALRDNVFSREDALLASKKYGEYLHKLRKAAWDSLLEAFLMNASRLALIGGDTDRALRLLDDDRAGRWHRVEAHALRAIIADMRSAERREPSSVFDEFFNTVRDPDFKANVFVDTRILGFELGIIRSLCVAGGVVSDYREVARLVAGCPGPATPDNRVEGGANPGTD